MLRWLMIVVLAAQSAGADPVSQVTQAAHLAFDRLPDVRRVDQIAGHCGADETVNQTVAYCTTRNQIFLRRSAQDDPQTPYMLAHAFGHAVQVRHGVADFALAEIRQRRSEEAMLRGLVTRQAECIAGFIVARAEFAPTDLTSLFADEPFTGSHWGRDPLHIGPEVSIGLAPRAEWFAIGQLGDLAACAPGEFTSDLLLQALNP
ncbi:hypothetical protein QTO30_05305 [Yoonia sp. GPGPB17]|uniref:hypothetical protein n=1 Tax=Yoonia sp. GPGPB17 TaxID=3026147 RepID=UPI0030C3F9D7